jgi:folate-binding protein YgfZ
MRGIEGLDLLQRISTNELTKMRLGEWTPTVLTNEKGRMIDVVWVGRQSEDLLLLLAGAHSAQKAKGWIEKFIIMEDVQINQPEQRFIHLAAIGDFGFPQGIPLMEFEHRWGDVTIRHALLSEEKGKEEVRLLEERGWQRKSVAEYENFRIVAGIPFGANEISENFNPLEAGLDDLVSWTKGCYVGQEVIARLDTYKKVQKRLVRLELAESVDTVPTPIRNAGGEAGMLTSVTIQGPYRGLGYVGTRQLETGSDLFVDGKSGQIRVNIKE